MTCPLCGLQFSEAEGIAACRSCPLGKSCHLVKCPRCGYELPRKPRLVKLLEGWRRTHGSGRKG